MNYHIIQLSPSKYILLDGDFNKMDKTGKVLSEVFKKERAYVTLGQMISFIKKNGGTYSTYIPYKVPQLTRAIKDNDEGTEKVS